MGKRWELKHENNVFFVVVSCPSFCRWMNFGWLFGGAVATELTKRCTVDEGSVVRGYNWARSHRHLGLESDDLFSTLLVISPRSLNRLYTWYISSDISNPSSIWLHIHFYSLIISAKCAYFPLFPFNIPLNSLSSRAADRPWPKCLPFQRVTESHHARSRRPGWTCWKSHARYAGQYGL